MRETFFHETSPVMHDRPELAIPGVKLGIDARTGTETARDFRKEGVMQRRPQGFKAFVKQEDFHALLLVMNGADQTLSLFRTIDPKEQLRHLVAKSPPIPWHRAWWLAGPPVSARVEHAFKDRFGDHLGTGNAYRLPASDAVRFIESFVVRMGTWHASEAEIIDRMDRVERRKQGLPLHAPSPLRGMGSQPLIL